MNLSPRHADLLLKFLANTNIVGNDAPAFMECVLMLQSIVSSQPQEVKQRSSTNSAGASQPNGQSDCLTADANDLPN